MKIKSTSYIRNSLLAKIPTITYTEKLKIHLPLFHSFFYCMLIGLVASCSKNESEDRNHLVFRYNEHANISSLDPAFAKDQRNIWACHQLYNTLVELDDSLHIVPSIAKNWDVSEDGLSYVFQLREDVFFHKNEVFGDAKTRNVEAKDVVFSLQRLRDPKVASSGSWILKQVQTIKAISKFKVEIILHQAFPPFLGLLSMKYASIVPIEVEEKNFNFRNNPIGTGPFYFKRWEENEKLVFRKNNKYFEKDENGIQLPYLEAVAITFLPEKQGEFMEFIQGKIDFLSGLHPSYKDELIDLSGNLLPDYQNRIKMQKSPYLNTEYIGLYLDTSNPFLREKKFRQALNYGLNRSLMMKYLRNNVGIPATKGFVPQGLPGAFEDEIFTYQPERATSLVNEVKTKLNNPKAQIRIATNASYIDLIEFVQKEWTKLGIEVFIDVMPASTLLQQRSAGKLEAFRGSWIADYPDAENYLTLFTSADFSPNGPNYTHFSAAKFDDLYLTSLSETSSEKRYLIYSKMDSLVMEESPVVPLFYDEVIRFKQKNVSGLGINPLNLLDLRKVKKEVL